jgi:hypothetical protein
MKHISLFEDYSNKVNEGSTPLYNELDFKKNINAAPVEELKYSEIIPRLRDLLAQKEMGSVENINVIAEVPTQGKGAPDYIKDIIAQERERLARQYKSTIGKKIGSDVEAEEFDFDVNRFGDQRTIFFDSEFIVDRIENVGGNDMIIGIPASLPDKGYEAKISPMKVDEIYFTPAGEE